MPNYDPDEFDMVLDGLNRLRTHPLLGQAVHQSHMFMVGENIARGEPCDICGEGWDNTTDPPTLDHACDCAYALFAGLDTDTYDIVEEPDHVRA